MTRAEFIDYMRGLQAFRGKISPKWRDRLDSEVRIIGAIMTAMDMIWGTNWKIELE